MELKVLDPWEHGNHGSQPLIRCIDHTENYNYHAPALRFDASHKRAYGRWWVMVDVTGRWMRVVGLDGCKVEAYNGGRAGYPAEFYNPKSIGIFLDVCRN